MEIKKYNPYFTSGDNEVWYCLSCKRTDIPRNFMQGEEAVRCPICKSQAITDYIPQKPSPVPHKASVRAGFNRTSNR